MSTLPQPTTKTGPTIWSASRRGGGRKLEQAADAAGLTTDVRSAFERDHDRVLFSTPVRRMADKTQVFPLERNDSVRNRLTHSHEVSNLAWSIGNRLVRTKRRIFGSDEGDAAAPVILATVGLAHDLGNPPFGHKGEEAIQNWFRANEACIFRPDGQTEVPDDLRSDFLQFEGNAQTLRLLTQLQVSVGGFGLDLTAATIAALMKYTIPSSKAPTTSRAKKLASAAAKKTGFFGSEAQIVDWVRSETGLSEGQRHPITWLMEACDDVAYSVLDVEDAIKKSIVSPEDVLAHIRRKSKNDVAKGLVDILEGDFQKAHETTRSSKSREIKTSYLRSRLIEKLISAAANTFIDKSEDIFLYTQTQSLLDCGTPESDITNELKSFARIHAYNHQAVLRAELQGALCLSKLLDWFWEAIRDRRDVSDPSSPRTSPFGVYVYGLISENYRWDFEEGSRDDDLPLRYRELRLLTDMISGMTDSYALQLYNELEHVHRG